MYWYSKNGLNARDAIADFSDMFMGRADADLDDGEKAERKAILTHRSHTQA